MGQHSFGSDYLHSWTSTSCRIYTLRVKNILLIKKKKFCRSYNQLLHNHFFLSFCLFRFKPPAAIGHQSNGRLNGAEKLFDGEIKGPEYFDSYDGVLYTALHLGTVSKLVGNKLVEVVKFGKKCGWYWLKYMRVSKVFKQINYCNVIIFLK